MEPEKNKSETKTKAAGRSMAGEHQDNLAEGERETVEESIRIHEAKGDLKETKPKRESQH
jgi:hypothetical protein